MTSRHQIDANRRNAKRSTGPVTPEGKAASSRNALKHGFRANQVLFGDDERLDSFRAQLEAEYQPANFVEAIFVEQMAVALFKRLRFEELEARYAGRLACESFLSLEIIWRRQASLERAFQKALHQLQQLRQAARPRPEPKPRPAAQPKPERPVPAPELPDPAPDESPSHEPYKYVMSGPGPYFDRS